MFNLEYLSRLAHSMSQVLPFQVGRKTLLWLWVKTKSGLSNPELFHAGCPGHVPVIVHHLCPAILIQHFNCAFRAQPSHMHWTWIALVKVIHIEESFAWDVVDP